MVYKAKLSSGDVVAVKRAKADRKQDAGKFRKEIELLSRVSHKNLVRLVGYCREGGEQLLVYEYVAGGNLSQNLNPTWRERGEQLRVCEYVAGGDLSQNLNPTWRERHSRPPLNWTGRLLIAAGTARGLAYLHEEINSTCRSSLTPFLPFFSLHLPLSSPFSQTHTGHSRPPLNWTERLLIAAGTARGLAYLHEEINVPFIHRDVKPSNIMIDRHVVAKIADFGTTKPMTPEELRKMSVTIQGTAPSNIMIDRHVVAKVADFGTSKPMTPEELRKMSVTIQGTAWRVSPVPLADFGTSKPMTPEELRKMSVTIQGTAGYCDPDYLRLLRPGLSAQGALPTLSLHPIRPAFVCPPLCFFAAPQGYCDPDYLRTGHSSKRIDMLPAPGYCDPDYLRTGHSSKRIDVYSLGIVLLELLTGKGPHKVNRPYRFDVKDRFDRGGLPSIVDPTMGLYPADELHHVFDLALHCTALNHLKHLHITYVFPSAGEGQVKDRFDRGGLPSIVDPTMGLYPADELHHVFDLALRCTDIQNPAARPSMSRVVAELEAVLEPEAISRFISSGPPSHDSADFRTAPSGSGAGPGGAGLTRFAGAGKQVGQGGGEGGAGLAAAGSGVEGLAVGGTAGAALAAAISSASPSRSDAGDSPLTPDPPIPPNRSQPQPTPASYAPLPPPSSKRTPGPPAYKGRAAGVAAAGAAEATGGDIRGMRDRELDGACVPTGQNDPRSTGGTYVVSHDVGVQMKPAPVAAFRGASAAAGGGATGAGVIVAGASGGNAGGIGGGGGVAAPNQEYRAGEGFGEGEGGGERGEGGYEEGLDASFDSSGFDRSGVFSYGAMPPA
ncbi:unnamed protein product [Closterium sp. NIES-64]|nr:unnamed protein product [Closterium sp. NIES-64]